MKINSLLKLPSSYSLLEKKIILSYLLGCNNLDLYLINDDINNKIVKKYKKLIKKTRPVSYLLNRASFLGHNFYVNKNVLIPRFETENLVLDVENYINKYFSDNVSICDIGTGSGCIAISLSLLNKNYQIDALDISSKALKVAKKNNKLLNTNVNFIKSDMLKNVTKKYDILISNPPYIYENDKNIDPKVIKYEPHLALFGGIKYYEEILKEAHKYLNDKSLIAFEIGYNEKKDINNLVKKYLPDAKIINSKDLNNYDRYIYILNNID